MLQSIKDMLVQIGDFCRNVADWFTDFIEDTIFFLQQLSATADSVTALLGDIFPPALVTAFVALLTIVVILRILGRD